MALVLLQPGIEPIGQYDSVDGYTTTILGGEVCTFTSVVITADKAAADSLDGYLNPGTSRAALTVNLPTAAGGPWMLTDDGTAHYGTLFGVVVGGTVGQVASGGYSPGSSGGLIGSGTVLGPHTALASGKWTAWDKPGLYGVTLDATDTTLQPTSATPQPGVALYALPGISTGAQVTGRLTTTSSAMAGNNLIMARFVEFRTNNALVTTPNRLVSALNSPSSTVSGTLPLQLYMAVVHFQPGQ
jgi:hypothetical protein